MIGMSAALEIRPFEGEDEPGLLAAYAAAVEEGGAFPRRPPIDLATFREAWLHGAATVQVARQGGVVVGGYFLKPAFPGLGGHIANAGYVVAREYRGRGVGRALAEHSFVEAQARGFDAMLFNLVLARNRPSRRLWESLGFTQLGAIPNAIDGEEALILWRSLTSPSIACRHVDPQRDLTIREAGSRDVSLIAAIYTEAVLARAGTFDTTPPAAETFTQAIGSELILVAEDGGAVVGWARLGPYMPRRAGIGIYQLYVASGARGRGVGGQLLTALVERAQRAGYFKMVGRMLASNQPALRAASNCGFRTVGVLRRHGTINGEWQDVIEVERLLGDATLA